MTTRRSLVAELKRRNVLRAAALYIGAAAIARQHSSGSVEAVAADSPGLRRGPRYPLLKATLASQGIEPPPPLPEAFACKPSAASR